VKCVQENASAAAFMRRLNRKVLQDRIPLTGSLALTHRCPLRCPHCYALPTESELATADWQGLIEQCAAAGCLNLLLTGGDPVIRGDFAAIYRHAKLQGMLVIVFTTGMLIGDDTLDLFRDLPPHAVEVTLYGATAGTFDAVSGVRGSFRRCVGGVERMLGAGVRVKLKTLLLSGNRHEFHAMERLAAGYGVPFRLDACVFPRLNGDRRPLDFRISAAEAVELEFADAGRTREWQAFHERMRAAQPGTALYACGAGRTAFHIDPCGALYPCVMMQRVRADVRGRDFAAAWRSVTAQVAEHGAAAPASCRECEARTLCGYCPGFFELESEPDVRPSDFLCEIGRRRLDRLRRLAAASA
jgi:radical SAM protein with 4Fe4S-binding SPASM domain